MASAPAARISAGKKPPHWLSPMAPVRGERAHAVMRLWPEMARPVRALTAMTRTLSGPRGSAPAGMDAGAEYAASALPPGYFRYTSSGSVLVSMVPRVRST